MRLSMTVLRCPDQVAPEARNVSGGEFHVGRGPDVDWVLPDADRLLSKRHFAVAFRGGGWQVADTSTNGTWLNGDAEPIGRGATRPLRDGDRLRLGAYEIEIRLVDQPAYAAGGFGAGAGGSGQSQFGGPFGDPFADDPLAPAPADRRPFDEPAYPEGHGDYPVAGMAPGDARLPHDFDPLAPDHEDEIAGGNFSGAHFAQGHDSPGHNSPGHFSEGHFSGGHFSGDRASDMFHGPVQGDHSSSMEDAIVPPGVSGYVAPAPGVIPGGDLLPDDWDKDLLEGIAPPEPLVATPERGANLGEMPPPNMPRSLPEAPPVPETAPLTFMEPLVDPLLDPLVDPLGDPLGPVEHPAHAGSSLTPIQPVSTPGATGAPVVRQRPQRPANTPAMLSPMPASPGARAADIGDSGPHAEEPGFAGPDFAAADFAGPAGAGSKFAGPDVAAPDFTDADFTDPDFTDPGFTDPGFARPGSTGPGSIGPGSGPGSMGPSIAEPDAIGPALPRPPLSVTPAPDDIDPFNEPEPAPAKARSPAEPASAAAPFNDPSSASPAPTRPKAAVSGDSDPALEAFFEGARISGAMPLDPIAMMTGLGQAFRAMISGLRAVLIARATIKSEFRIEQTMIRARGNNPLKFSANDDDALTALLGVGRRVDMTPAAAIEDSLRDLRLHELATMAAMQAAVRAMLDELAPEKIRSGTGQSGMAVLPAQRKARAWDAFEARHAEIVQALVDDFDSIFGKTFARAYERALDEISIKERQ